jgi:hypothetical protein
MQTASRVQARKVCASDRAGLGHSNQAEILHNANFRMKYSILCAGGTLRVSGDVPELFSE